MIAAASRSKAGIARDYGLSDDAVLHHAHHHLPAALAKGQQIKDMAHADSLYAEVKALVKKGQTVLAWALKQKTVGGGHLTLSAIRELRETFETLAKTAAELKAQEASDSLEDTQTVRAALDASLDRLAERLRQSEAEPPAPPTLVPTPAGPVH